MGRWAERGYAWRTNGRYRLQRHTDTHTSHYVSNMICPAEGRYAKPRTTPDNNNHDIKKRSRYRTNNIQINIHSNETKLVRKAGAFSHFAHATAFVKKALFASGALAIKGAAIAARLVPKSGEKLPAAAADVDGGIVVGACTGEERPAAAAAAAESGARLAERVRVRRRCAFSVYITQTHRHTHTHTHIHNRKMSTRRKCALVTASVQQHNNHHITQRTDGSRRRHTSQNALTARNILARGRKWIIIVAEINISHRRRAAAAASITANRRRH